MPQTKTEIQSLLQSIGSKPRHRFGQNFMIDQNLVRVIVDAGQLGPDDSVLEVGPGTGTLTDELLLRGARVTAIEIDRDLATLLRQRHVGNDRFTLLEGDALDGKHALHPALRNSSASSGASPRKLVANLPYNIASPLVIELLIAGFDLLVFTVQKEVADRLRARESSDDYGPLSVMSAMLARVEVLRTLPRQAFWPAPKIESALVRMTRDDRLGAHATAFGAFVQKLFSFRRKMLRRAITECGHDPSSLDVLSIEPTLRPENLSPPRLFDLYQYLHKPAES